MLSKAEDWEVDLDLVRGHEPAKVRPCVVISNKLVNAKMGLSIVVPITGTAWMTNEAKLLRPASRLR
ncbi:type II toxin-antitoxin system PemK/MazF family toxin [bacterium]|nr:type II toxin-antitoxin system PemK/MazF family toxin [bacterium]MBP9806931.1 type II toxin-antitoxin system PemK/MazF family toxin [bacterium]